MSKQLTLRRVVITGLGLVTPLDIGVPKTWDKLCQGQSGIGPITRFDASQFPVQIAGEVKNFDPGTYIEKKEIKKIKDGELVPDMDDEDETSSSNIPNTYGSGYRTFYRPRFKF